MSTPQYRVDLDVPEGWVELPESAGDELATWAAATADRLGAADDLARTLLVDDLVGWTEDALAHGIALTLLCYVDGQVPPLAVVQLGAVAPPEGAGSDPAENALAALTAGSPPWLEPPAVQQVRIDAGDAVRIRGRSVDQGPSGDSVVMHVLSYLLAPEAFGGWLSVTGSWFSLDLTGEIEAAVDSVLSAVEVERLS